MARLDPVIQTRLTVDRRQVAAFCRRWKITELALFGSVLDERFRPESDIDVLVAFDPEARWSLFDRAKMRDELSEIFGREIDLVSRRSVERSPNWLRREAILTSARPYYAA